MQFKIAIIDDMESDCEQIKRMIERYRLSVEDSFEVTVFNTAEDFLKVYIKGAFHIIFLDICMKGMDGIELSNRLRISDENIRIIFMSTEHGFVFDIWKAQPTSFLCKPYSFDKFSEALGIALDYFQKAERLFEIKLSRTICTVKQSDVIAVIAEKHTSMIKLTTGETYTSSTNYTEISESLLKEPNFLECNRGVLVNMDHAVTSDSKTAESITMEDGTVYPIRVKGRKQVISQLSAYQITKKLKGGL